MNVKEITDQKEWDAALEGMHSHFLQSFWWGEFQREKGFRVFRLQGSDNHHRVCAQWIVQPLPFGFSYWYSPYGPITTIQPGISDYTDAIVSYIQQIRSYATNSVFLRIEPTLELCYESEALELAATLGLKKTASVQVKDTRMLDLRKPETQLLSEMHPKTRYNINLAERKGVQVRTGKKFIEDFIRLNKETTARDGFTSHPDAHYRLMAKTLPDEMLSVYAAEYEGTIVASNLVITYGGTTTYVHGASTSSNRNIMAPHLLQWRQIQDAKNAQSKYYDFWGIASSRGHSAHAGSWAGISRFKNGFGGIEKNYVGAYDLPIRKKLYTLYSILRTHRI